MQTPTPQKLAGNVLIFILIAIFLLGGLTMLLSRGSQTTEETGSAERTNIKVSEMLRHTAGMEQAVQKLLMNGCSESQISFNSTKWGFPAQYDSLPANDKPECYVFRSKGGNYPFKKVPEGLQTSATPSDYFITGFYDVLNIGSANTDLLIVVPGLTEQACAQVNRILGVQNYARMAFSSTPVFTGTFPPSAGPSVVGSGGTNPTYVAGKKAACLQSTSVMSIVGTSVVAYTPAPPDNVIYVFCQVLIPR